MASQRPSQPPRFVAASRLRRTPRSRRGPTAGAREAPRNMMLLAGAYRRPRLTSNVLRRWNRLESGKAAFQLGRTPEHMRPGHAAGGKEHDPLALCEIQAVGPHSFG